MLRASIIFFVLAIASMVLGLNSIAGLSVEIGKILLIVFLVLSVLSFLFGRSRGKGASLAVAALLLTGISLHSSVAVADETVTEKAKEMGNDTKRAGKDAARQVKDKTCEMVNGKMECAAKKVKHSIQKGADKVEDAVD